MFKEKGDIIKQDREEDKCKVEKKLEVWKTDKLKRLGKILKTELWKIEKKK